MFCLKHPNVTKTQTTKYLLVDALINYLYTELLNCFFFFSILVSVRETCADWQAGMEPQDDPALKGKKDQDNFKLKVPRRTVGK